VADALLLEALGPGAFGELPDELVLAILVVAGKDLR
jgi:hypothetical protein